MSSAVIPTSHLDGLPKPITRVPALPDPADIRALRSALKKTGISDRAAGAISTIWTNPTAVLPQVENPQRRRIPGAYLRVISGQVYTARVVPDPYNPRNADQVHFALAGTVDAPPAALMAAAEHGRGEMAIHVPSPDLLEAHLTWAVEKTRARNNPHPNIADQGIMDPPIGVATTFFYDDDTSPTSAVLVREGSTRISWGHRYVGVSAQDVLFRLPRGAASMAELIEWLNSLASQPYDELEESDRAAVRCAVTEFELIIGVEPDVQGEVDLSQAIKARVAQDHLNPKTRWTVESKNTSLAEECLISARAANVIETDHEARWLGGYLTHAEASTCKIPPHGDDRAAWLIHMFTTNEPRTHDAIRGPIAMVLTDEDEAATRRRAVRVEGNTKLPLGIEVVARELHGNPTFSAAKVNFFRKNLRDALPRNLSKRGPWKRTKRSPQALFDAAVHELADGRTGGLAGTELWVRAAYVLCKHNMIGGPRHDQGPDGDRRPAGQVIEELLGTEAGLQHLRQILEDDRLGLAPRRVDSKGQILKSATGEDVPITNDFLRDKLAPKTGTVQPTMSPDEAAHARFKKAMEAVKHNMRVVEDSMRNLAAVKAPDDGRPLVTKIGKADTYLLREGFSRIAGEAEAWWVAAVQAQGGSIDDADLANLDDLADLDDADLDDVDDAELADREAS